MGQELDEPGTSFCARERENHQKMMGIYQRNTGANSKELLLTKFGTI